jgi:hypothetical protein
MSHFLVGVIVPKGTKNVQSYIDGVMDAYNENLEVNEYKGDDGEPCTYNPDSKWDWYVVGGRWDGIISKNGEQMPSDDGGFNFGDKHHDIENNTCMVRHLPAKSLPFAIVTPDGEWHEKGSMGWWGITKDEKEDKKWEKEVAEILKEYKNDYMVGMDCHI